MLMIVTTHLAWADSAADRRASEDLIRQGVELRRHGDDQGASVLMKKAYDLAPSPRAAAQLGLVEQARGRWSAGYVHLTEALQAKDDPWVKKNHPSLEEALRIATQHVGKLEIAGEPTGAQVFVDGLAVGTLPIIGATPVSAGDLDVELRAPGYSTGHKRVAVAAGAYERTFIHLDRDAAAQPAVATAPAPVEPTAVPVATAPVAPAAGAPVDEGATHRSTRGVLTWVSFGGAAAFLVGAIAETVVHESKVSDFTDKKGPTGQYLCYDRNGTAVSQTGGPTDASCQSLLDGYRSAKTLAIVGYVGAGILAATGAVLLATRPSASGGETAQASAWACAPELTSPGVSCFLRF